VTATPVDSAWRTRFDALMDEQRERSRSAAQGLFKGGLADHSEETTKLHTQHTSSTSRCAVLGDHVIQRGSNVTLSGSASTSHTLQRSRRAACRGRADRERGHRAGLADELSRTADRGGLREGAFGAFGDKYGRTVKVYTAGDPEGEWYSKEICGGPHVEHTAMLGHFRIVKEESSSAGVSAQSGRSWSEHP